MSWEIQKQSIVRTWLGSDSHWAEALCIAAACKSDMSACEAHLVNTLCGCKGVWLAPEVLNISPHFFPLWTASFDQIHPKTTGQNSLPTVESPVSPAVFYLHVCQVLTSLAHSLQHFLLPLPPEEAASLSHFGRMKEEKLISLNLGSLPLSANYQTQ